MTTLLRVACADISAHARDLLAFGILGLAVVVLAVGGQGVVDGFPRLVGLAGAVEELLVLLELLQDVS